MDTDLFKETIFTIIALFTIIPLVCFLIWWGVVTINMHNIDHCKKISKNYKELELCINKI